MERAELHRIFLMEIVRRLSTYVFYLLLSILLFKSKNETKSFCA